LSSSKVSNEAKLPEQQIGSPRRNLSSIRPSFDADLHNRIAVKNEPAAREFAARGPCDEEELRRKPIVVIT
jgi:hypothetical protein